MADIYKVIVDKLSVMAQKKSDGVVVKTLRKGLEVKVYNKTPGEKGVYWGKISKKDEQWINMAHVKKLGGDAEKNNTKDDKTTDNEDDSEYDNTVYGQDLESYNKVMMQRIRAFGAPPRFTQEVDPWYYVTDSVGVGRAMAETWYSQPSILSICPGTVNYLPGFTKKKKDKFFNRVKEMIGDKVTNIDSEHNADANGQLYSFKSANADYFNVVNLIARIISNDMGIGNVTNIIEGCNTPLNTFDYTYFTEPSKFKPNKGGLVGLFDELKKSVDSSLWDNSYIHFFTNQSGSNVTESITTESGQSWLETQLTGSGLDAASRNIQFLFGGAISEKANTDIRNVVDNVKDSGGLLSGFATIAKNYINGGRLVFPQMITGMHYNKSVNVETTFMSPSGDRRSIFKYVMIPVAHLLALAVPKQVTSNMYTYPFLVKIRQAGVVDMDLAFISNLDLTRGGSDNTSWTTDNLPTEVTARFTVTPLYSNLMVTSSKNPYLALCNSALMEYLGNMVGLDLTVNGFNRQIELAKMLLYNKVHDIPTNVARVSGQNIGRGLRKFTSALGLTS